MTTVNGDLRATIQELVVEIAVLKARAEKDQEALAHQATEYKRRLEDLNHAHDRAEEARNHTLPREIYDLFLTDISAWRAKINEELATNRGRNSMLVSGIAFVFAALALIGQAIIYFLNLIN